MDRVLPLMHNRSLSMISVMEADMVNLIWLTLRHSRSNKMEAAAMASTVVTDHTTMVADLLPVRTRKVSSRKVTVVANNKIQHLPVLDHSRLTNIFKLY